VQEGIRFEKVVEAAIAGDLQFWPDTQCSFCFFRLADAEQDSFQITIEVQGPLVELTCCECGYSFELDWDLYVCSVPLL
jgi:hypothetical protein